MKQISENAEKNRRLLRLVVFAYLILVLTCIISMIILHFFLGIENHELDKENVVFDLLFNSIYEFYKLHQNIFSELLYPSFTSPQKLFINIISKSKSRGAIILWKY